MERGTLERIRLKKIKKIPVNGNGDGFGFKIKLGLF